MTNNFTLEEAIHVLDDRNLNFERFKNSALSNNTFFDERKSPHNQKINRHSEKKEAEDALNNYQRNPDILNKIGVLSELADLYYKEKKALIIYENQEFANQIKQVRLDFQLKALLYGLKITDEIIRDVATVKYSNRAQNLLEKKPVKEIKTEIQKIFEVYQSYM